MKLCLWAGAIALACSAVPATAQTQLPAVKDWAGRTVPANGTMLVDKTGVALDTSVPLAAANTALPAVPLSGGTYVLTQLCTAYGSVALRYRAPDGVTMVTLLTRVAPDAAGTVVQFGSGAIVDVLLTGATGCNATLSRIP